MIRKEFWDEIISFSVNKVWNFDTPKLFIHGNKPGFEERLLSKTLLNKELIKAIIIPHAHESYSGKCARMAFEEVKDKFENYENIFVGTDNNKFNKNIILLSLREMTNLSTKEIRTSMKKFRVIYFNLLEKMVK